MIWKARVRILTNYNLFIIVIGDKMRERTFFRIMLDNLLVNNAICKSITSLVNFCNEQSYFATRKLKFSKKMPLNNISQDSVYKNKFIFNNTYKSGVDYK